MFSVSLGSYRQKAGQNCSRRGVLSLCSYVCLVISLVKVGLGVSRGRGIGWFMQSARSLVSRSSNPRYCAIVFVVPLRVLLWSASILCIRIARPVLQSRRISVKCCASIMARVLQPVGGSVDQPGRHELRRSCVSLQSRSRSPRGSARGRQL